MIDPHFGHQIDCRSLLIIFWLLRFDIINDESNSIKTSASSAQNDLANIFSSSWVLKKENTLSQPASVQILSPNKTIETG